MNMPGKVRSTVRGMSRPILLVGALVLLPGLFAASAIGYKLPRLNPEPLSAPQDVPARPVHDPDKLTAVVIAGNNGAEVTDFIGPYTVFATSGEYNVYAVSPEARTAPLTGGLDILPHYSFDEFDRTFQRSPDLIVIPYLPSLEGPDSAIVPWIQSHAGPDTVILSICAGSDALARTGLLDGLDSTIYSTWFARVEREFPAVNWVRNVRWVDNGNIVSSAGITSGIDASLHVLDRTFGRAKALEVAAAINYPHVQFLDDPTFTPQTFGRAIVTMDWLFSFGSDIGVVIYEGVNDLALSSVFDTYPLTGGRLTAVSLTDGIVRSEHGLFLMPRAHTSASGLDRVILPGTTAPEAVVSAAQELARSQGVELLQVHADTPERYAFDATLMDVARTKSLSMAEFLARRLEYPASHIQFTGGYPVNLVLRPVLLGLVGLVAAAWVTRPRTPRRAAVRPVAVQA